MTDYEDFIIDLYEYTPYDLLQEFLSDKEKGIEKRHWNLIPKVQYQNLLRRYMENPEMARIPFNTVDGWFRDIICHNAICLEYITDFAGHSQSFPFDDFEEVFEDYDGEKTYEEESEYLDKLGFYDWCVLPDGSDGWSDYGLEPLFKIIKEYASGTHSAEEVLVLVNRALDVYHQRGDLASAFIEGGSRTCWDISNESVNESDENIWTYCHGYAVPDGYRFTYDGKRYAADYDDDETAVMPFAYYDGKLILGNIGCTHLDMADGHGIKRTDFKNEGRIYLDDGVLIFRHGVPTKEELRKFCNEMAPMLKERYFLGDVEDFILVKPYDPAVDAEVKDGVGICRVKDILYNSTPSDEIVRKKRMKNDLDAAEREGRKRLNDVDSIYNDTMYRRRLAEGKPAR